MTPEARRRRLESLAREARGRSVRLGAELEHRRDLPAGPGDLVVLAATAELPVEWAILDRRNGELLAVPADTHPLVGSADLSVEPDRSLVLRCLSGLWLSAAMFKTHLRTGVLSAESVTAALHRWRQLEKGELAASPLAEEVDADPEYREWIRDVPQRARALALAAQGPSQVTPGGAAWATRLAAVLALATIGMSVWVFQLRQEVAWLSEPAALSEAIDMSDDTRGDTVVTVPREAKSFHLRLLVDSVTGPHEGYVEITNHDGDVVYRSSLLRFPTGGQLAVPLTRRRLPDGVYRIRLYSQAGFTSDPLSEKRLRVETEE